MMLFLMLNKFRRYLLSVLDERSLLGVLDKRRYVIVMIIGKVLMTGFGRVDVLIIERFFEDLIGK